MIPTRINSSDVRKFYWNFIAPSFEQFVKTSFHVNEMEDLVIMGHNDILKL